MRPLILDQLAHLVVHVFDGVMGWTRINASSCSNSSRPRSIALRSPGLRAIHTTPFG
jgi:hypothetical protein